MRYNVDMPKLDDLNIEPSQPDPVVAGVAVPERMRWSLFAAYYAETGNARKSAIRAGYSARRAAQTGYDLLKKDWVKERVREINMGALEKIRERGGAGAVTELAYVFEQCAEIIELAKRSGQYGAAVSAVKILSEAHPEFKNGPIVDSRTVNLVIPEGTSLDDLMKLRDEFQQKLVG